MYHSQNAERRLAMTFQISQSLAILQMARCDLEQFIQEEIDKNPLLEDLKKKNHSCNFEIASTTSVHEFLLTQIREAFSDLNDRKIAESIAESLDEKGFLVETPIEHESILSILQTLEPPGIFARNLQESLLLQLKAKGLDMSSAYTLIKNDYEHLVHHRYSVLKKKYPHLDLFDAIQKIASLQLRPLESLRREIYCPIIPDLYIRQTDTSWLVGMCNEIIPRFRVQYENLKPESKEEQKTIDLWRSSGKWLLNALSRRREILLKIALRLTYHQSTYLSQKGNLLPFTIQDLASELGVHESTISRALSEKYVETPRGILSLKSLLTATPQKIEAKELLQELINQEITPLTDDQLADALTKKGYPIARRTISKYRRELKIPSTKMRAL